MEYLHELLVSLMTFFNTMPWGPAAQQTAAWLALVSPLYAGAVGASVTKRTRVSSFEFRIIAVALLLAGAWFGMKWGAIYLFPDVFSAPSPNICYLQEPLTLWRLHVPAGISLFVAGWAAIRLRGFWRQDYDPLPAAPAPNPTLKTVPKP